jgi:hypothetical protein
VEAGSIPLHLAKRHYGAITFVDLRALTTPHFTACPATARLRRKSNGIPIPYSMLFASTGPPMAGCDVPRPDVIFDFDSPDFRTVSLLTQHGYTLVYKQAGEVSTHSSYFPGGIVRANFFVLVRDDLVPWVDPGDFGSEEFSW